MLAQNNQAYFFDDKQGLKTQLVFKFDPNKLIITILI